MQTILLPRGAARACSNGLRQRLAATVCGNGLQQGPGENCVSVQIGCVFSQHRQRHNFQGAGMGGLEHDTRRLPVLIRFKPARRAQAPAVSGPQPRELELRVRSRQIVSPGEREVEKLAGDANADGMGAKVLIAGIAASIAKEPRDRVLVAVFQRLAEYVDRSIHWTSRHQPNADRDDDAPESGEPSNPCVRQLRVLLKSPRRPIRVGAAGIDCTNRVNTKSNVVLVGPMGSGKTAVGRQLARYLEMEFVDSDGEIERRTGVDITFIFDKEGEPGFRVRECAVIAELTCRDNVVLATGGGAVLDPGNRRLLGESGTVVYLDTSVAHQLERTRHSKDRPLLRNEEPAAVLQRLMEIRGPLYDEVADIVIKTGNQRIGVMVQEIGDRLREHGFKAPRFANTAGAAAPADGR